MKRFLLPFLCFLYVTVQAQLVPYIQLGTNSFFTNGFRVNSRHWTNQSELYTYPPVGKSVDDVAPRDTPGPPFFIRKDGSIFMGTNIVQEVNPTDYSKFYPYYAITMVRSNEAPNIRTFAIATDSEDFDYFGEMIYQGVADTVNASSKLNINSKKLGGVNNVVSLQAVPNLADFAIYVNNVFKVDGNGDIIRIKDVNYSWPSAYGDPNAVLSETDGAGTLKWTNSVNLLSVTATNFVLITTNYTAANFAPVPGFAKFVMSNGVLWKVTQLSTNLVSDNTP